MTGCKAHAAFARFGKLPGRKIIPVSRDGVGIRLWHAAARGRVAVLGNSANPLWSGSVCSIGVLTPGRGCPTCADARSGHPPRSTCNQPAPHRGGQCARYHPSVGRAGKRTRRQARRRPDQTSPGCRPDRARPAAATCGREIRPRHRSCPRRAARVDAAQSKSARRLRSTVVSVSVPPTM